MKKLLGTILFVSWVSVASAQDFPYHYFGHTVPLVSNPSLAAAGEKLSADVASYNLWAGGFKPLNDNILSFSYQFNGKRKARTRFDPRVGIGFVLANENNGPFVKNILQLIYAYHIPVSRDLQLSLGISGMIENMNIKLSELSPLNTDDPRLLMGSNKNILFDGGFGASLINERYTVSFSVLNIAPSDYRFEDPSVADIPNFRKYVLSGTYHYALNPKMWVSPLLTFRNIEKRDFGFDVSCSARFSAVQVGVGYRSEKTMFLFTKVELNGFEFSYTSENPMEANHMVGNGHNFSIGWTLSAF